MGVSYRELTLTAGANFKASRCSNSLFYKHNVNYFTY
jgi:hypothetical protein